MTRTSWPNYFFSIASVVATRSTCPRKRVGCVIVRDNRILSTGYNGSPPGEDHCEDVGCWLEDDHCLRSVHAEANAIATAARFGVVLDGATAYITISPCTRCSMLLKSAGISDVQFARVYP